MAWKFHFHNLHDGSLSPDVSRGAGGEVYIPCSFAPDGEECALNGGEFLSRFVELRTNERIVLINNFETRKFQFETRKIARTSSFVV